MVGQGLVGLMTFALRPLRWPRDRPVRTERGEVFLVPWELTTKHGNINNNNMN